MLCDTKNNQIQASPHIPNPAEEIVAAIPECDKSIAAEKDRLCPVSWLRKLGEHNTGHTSLEIREHWRGTELFRENSLV